MEKSLLKKAFTTILFVALGTTLLPAQEASVVTLIDEDFSLLTAGTNDEPDTTPLTKDGEWGEDATDESYLMDASLTKDGPWFGLSLRQAGGAIAMMGKSDQASWLFTPLKDYSGKMKVTLRARSLKGTTRLIIHFNKGGYVNSMPIDGMPQYKMATLNEGEWTQIEAVVDNKSADLDGNIGIQAITTVLIDDVKVTVEGESLVYPPILPLTDVSEKSFTAHWQEVRNADDYLFSLFRKQWLSDGDVTYKADFNDGTLPTEGFTFELTSADPFGNDGPDGSQAIHLFNGDKIVTASNHARLKNLRFYMRTMGATAEQLKEKNSVIQILVDTKIVTGGQLGFLNASALVDGDYLDMEELTGSFADNYFRVQLVALDMPEGAYFVIDNLEMETGRPYAYEPVQQDVVVEATEYTATDLNPEDYYFYTVKSRNSKLTVESPLQSVVYIATPTVLDATNVTNDSYTANWQPVAKATHYEVRNYFLAQVKKDYPDYPVISEDFSLVNDELTDATDPFHPESLGNQDEYFDELGLSNDVWFGRGNTVCQGMVGCDAISSDDINYIASPELDLSHNGGAYVVKVKAYGRVGDQFCVYDYNNMTLGSPAASGAFVPVDPAHTEDSAPGIFEGTLKLTGGTISTRLVFTTYGLDFMIDEISICQDLVAGDIFNQLLGMQTVAAPRTSCVFDHLSLFGIPYYYYTVTALSEDYDYYTQSQQSGYHLVDMTTGINTVGTDSDSEAKLFDLQGRRLPQNHNAKGIFITRKNGKSTKVIRR